MSAKYVCIEHATATGVADRWREQYFNNGAWRKTAYGDAGEIHEALIMLGPFPTIADVAKAIGNKSWSYISCDGCGEHVEKAVRVGRSDYDSTKRYCETCLREAVSILGDAA